LPFDPPGASDAVSLIVGGQSWQGWQRVGITRSMDQVPAAFTFQGTEKYPASSDMVCRPGDPCQVMAGSDLLITGYVDRYSVGLSARDHTVMIAGRSKSEDLVDCAAFIGDQNNPQYLIKNATAIDVAQQLASPYGITVSALNQGNGARSDYYINYGETAWEVIDHFLRISQLIAFDLPDGSVVLAQSGSASMASGFVQGQNIEAVSVDLSMDQRFSIYEAHTLSSDVLRDQGTIDSSNVGTVTDAGMPRFRKRIIVSEQTFKGQSIALARAQWEMNRRLGRSQHIIVRCDAWRDTGGALWDLNHLAPLSLPAIKVDPQSTWLIGAVTFLRDESGEHADVTLMPPAAFSPEPAGDVVPFLLTNVDPQRNNPTATPNPPTAPTPPL
jgi:prophage tail gpP-like protein